MLTSGNSNPLVCAANLLKVTRAEIPYDRLLGVDPNLTDRPGAEVLSEYKRDIEWLIATYEPRVEIESWLSFNANAASGHIRAVPQFKLKEEDELA